MDIVNELARRLGLGNKFWKDEESLYDYLLGPTGLAFAEFKTQKRLYAPLEFHQHEKKGFKTPSGKVELYSSILEKHGCAPLPVYSEPFQSTLSTPDLAQEFPLIMTSGRRPCFRQPHRRTAKTRFCGSCARTPGCGSPGYGRWTGNKGR